MEEKHKKIYVLEVLHLNILLVITQLKFVKFPKLRQY